MYSCVHAHHPFLRVYTCLCTRALPALHCILRTGCVSTSLLLLPATRYVLLLLPTIPLDKPALRLGYALHTHCFAHAFLLPLHSAAHASPLLQTCRAAHLTCCCFSAATYSMFRAHLHVWLVHPAVRVLHCVLFALCYCAHLPPATACQFLKQPSARLLLLPALFTVPAAAAVLPPPLWLRHCSLLPATCRTTTYPLPAAPPRHLVLYTLHTTHAVSLNTALMRCARSSPFVLPRHLRCAYYNNHLRVSVFQVRYLYHCLFTIKLRARRRRRCPFLPALRYCSLGYYASFTTTACLRCCAGWFWTGWDSFCALRFALLLFLFQVWFLHVLLLLSFALLPAAAPPATIPAATPACLPPQFYLHTSLLHFVLLYFLDLLLLLRCCTCRYYAFHTALFYYYIFSPAHAFIPTFYYYCRHTTVHFTQYARTTTAFSSVLCTYLSSSLLFIQWDCYYYLLLTGCTATYLDYFWEEDFTTAPLLLPHYYYTLPPLLWDRFLDRRRILFKSIL